MRVVTKYSILLFIAALILFLAKCSNPSTVKDSANAFLNTGDSASYVGMQTCRGCHADIYNTFVETGMGQSFADASQAKSAGHFVGDVLLRDSFLDFTYRPFWQNDTLFLQEFRLDKNGDTAHNIRQKIHYIVGSGQHTNSHIYSQGGLLFQAPFTVYTQTGKLDLPPGFEAGGSSRFARNIGLECMSCHNAMPTKFALGSENKFDFVPQGIDCERCHGPGSLHVKKISLGKITDTSKTADYSIVNPKRLDAKRQFDLCQRCHLQGNAVLGDGKSFLDFKPGMHLDSVMTVFLPRYENSDNQFIMASHADRLQQSQCYIKSNGALNCTSCHNPHVSVQKTNIQKFNKTCQSCHSTTFPHGCTAPEASIREAQNNCVQCHMPQSGSIDIPHVSVHDHKIAVPQTQQKVVTDRGAFLGLMAINAKKPNKKTRATAYLQQYERFERNPIFLDSAVALLDANAPIHLWVHYYYLADKPFNIVEMVEKNGGTTGVLSTLKNQSYNNQDAWTAYRISEAFRQFKDYNNALKAINVAVKLAPLYPDFLVKKSSILVLLEDFTNAEISYKLALDQNPNMPEAWSDLSYVLLVQEKYTESEKAVQRALALNPDYTQAKINLASLYLAQNKLAEAKKLLLKIRATNPNNKRVKAALEFLDTQNIK